MTVIVKNHMFVVIENEKEIACFVCFTRLVEFIEAINYVRRLKKV